jgi:hypothetical protein
MRLLCLQVRREIAAFYEFALGFLLAFFDQHDVCAALFADVDRLLDRQDLAFFSVIAGHGHGFTGLVDQFDVPRKNVEVRGRFGLGMLFQLRNQLVDLPVQIGTRFSGARNDQRRARLVDQDRVNLVDDGEIKIALDLVFERECKIVAQVVEAEFVVRRVGDI